MITNEVMTPAAEAAAQRYGLLVEGWRALFREAIGQSDFGSKRSFDRVAAQAYSMSRTFLATEEDIVERVCGEIVSDAHTDAFDQIGIETANELVPLASELLSESVAYLVREITIQIERDIAFLVKSLRQTALQIQIASRSQGIPLATALIQYRIGNTAQLQFFFHDRSSAKWPSKKFVRAVFRQSLLTLYNETVLLTLAEHGLDRAEVEHINPSSSWHGILVAMSSGTTMPTYAEIRNDIFHPNADAILRAPVEA